MADPVENSTSTSAEPAPKQAWTAAEQGLLTKLSSEEFKKVADARREVWSAGLLGFVGGVGAGVVGTMAYRRLFNPPWFKFKHAVLSVLGCGAFCSYAATTYRGMNAFAELGDVFQKVNAKPGSYLARTLESQKEDAAPAASLEGAHAGRDTLQAERLMRPHISSTDKKHIIGVFSSISQHRMAPDGTYEYYVTWSDDRKTHTGWQRYDDIKATAGSLLTDYNELHDIHVTRSRRTR